MRLELAELEPRHLPANSVVAALDNGVVYADGGKFQPFPGWTGSLSVAVDGSRIIVGAGPGGGPRVGVFDIDTFGRLTPDFFAFEDTFRGGVFVAAEDGAVYAAPGDGGGPVVVHYDRQMREVSRRYVANPAYRGGVTDLDADRYESQSRLIATPHPSTPDVSTRLIDRELAKLTTADIARLNSVDAVVYVYDGRAITDLPEFADLKGVPTPQEGDGGRTYDNVPAAAPGNRVYINPLSALVTLHEVGHVIAYSIDQFEFVKWIAFWIHHRFDFPTVYERENFGEAFAESFSRLRLGVPNPPGVDAVLNALLAS